MAEEKGPVLVVDDDPDLRDALCTVLDDAGYTTIAVGHGAEALATLSRGVRPCLILLDLMMPVMDGWKFLDALGADRAMDGLRIVAMTAVPDRCPSDIRCIAKPFTEDEILRIAGEHCLCAGGAVPTSGPRSGGRTLPRRRAYGA